jgi:hypothetical protein
MELSISQAPRDGSEPPRTSERQVGGDNIEQSSILGNYNHMGSE